MAASPSRSRCSLHRNSWLRALRVLPVWLVVMCACDDLCAQQDKLPAPLSLQQAIDVGTDGLHPELLAAHAREESAQADIARADSAYALEADINLEAARIEPAPNAFDPSPNDNKISLNIRKPLYDFGYTSSRLEAAETGVDAEQLEYRYAVAQQQIGIARSFFEVVLSDIKFAWDNEAMSMLYVRVDKTRDRFALKQVSEIDLLKAEAEYQQLLTVRRNTEISQRISRAKLAVTINRPGELSGELEAPDIHLEKLLLPDPEELISLALQSNLALKAQLRRVDAARVAMEAARKQSHPTLGAEIEIADYSRELPSREDWRAALNLKIPLFENSLVKSDVAAQRAIWLQQQALYYQKQSEVRQQVYDVWMQLNTLIARSGELEIAAQSAERALDKSRGEYDLELRTDYGDTLVNTSRVRYEQAKNRYDMIVEAMRLAMLTGGSPRSVIDKGVMAFDNLTAGKADENAN